MTRLNQVVAIHPDVQAAAEEARKEGLKELKVSDHFEGFRKLFVVKDEESIEQPPKFKNVQARVEEILHEVAYDYLRRYLDVEAQMTWANTVAVADVEVDGVLLLGKVPSTYLIFLETRLSELAKLIEAAPLVDAAQDWKDKPNNNGLWETDAAWVNSTKKIKDKLILFDPTDKQPGQATLVDVDQVEGRWETVNFSGALLPTRKRELLRRVKTLYEAVKTAREKANLTDAPPVEVGKKVLDFILAE